MGLQDITKPTVTEWATPMETMMAVMEMEKAETKTLTDLETLATTKADFHLASFIQETFLTKQITDIKTIGDFLTKMKRVGPGLGVYMVYKDLTAHTRKWIANTRTGTFTVEEDVTEIVK